MANADDLLLCDESVALATPRKETTARVAKPLPKPSPSVVSARGDAREDETWFDVCPWEAIEMRLRREASGDYTRDANYIVAVQTHGMDAMWRAKMCRWMFETAQAFKLTQDSVGCAIHFMDQYLSEHSVDKVMLQLLCLVCMYIAAKMHESEPITMKEMELLCENKFTPDQILAVEAKVLEVLEWKLNAPVAFTFARDFLTLLEQQHECDPEDLEAHTMALVQVATEDFGSVQFTSSAVGIAAVKLIARAHSLPVLEASVTKALAQLQLPRREIANCYAYLCRIYIGHFQPDLVYADLAEAPVKAVIDTTPTASSDPHPRIDSPTSVEECFESRPRKTSSSLQRLIAAVDSSETETNEPINSPSRAKRSRRD